jgi:hypothetical protein
MLTSSLYETCRHLFVTYPLAADDAGSGGAAQSIMLLLRDADAASYFVLSHYSSEGTSEYSICPWPAGQVTAIEADGDGLVPGVLASAVRQGTPLPRDGSLLGWTQDRIVTALIAVYTADSPEVSEPYWSVMPRAGTPRAQWPPFTGEALLGDWFWELLQGGHIVSIEGLVSGAPETVFWAYTDAIFGSGCCVVTRDLRSPERYTLPSGCYVYHEALYASRRLPTAQQLLTSVGKTDLATRFR